METPKFTCYEIWRPNIPQFGCENQCKECKQEEQKEKNKQLL